MFLFHRTPTESLGFAPLSLNKGTDFTAFNIASTEGQKTFESYHSPSKASILSLKTTELCQPNEYFSSPPNTSVVTFHPQPAFTNLHALSPEHHKTSAQQGTQHASVSPTFLSKPQRVDLGYDPTSTYDVPKSALIACGHYKVPPLTTNVVQPCQQEFGAIQPKEAMSEGEFFDTQGATVPGTAVSGMGPSKSPIPQYSHYDVPSRLFMGSPTHTNKQYPDMQNSSKIAGIYDVPRKTLLTCASPKSPPPPKAPKPKRSSFRSSSSSSTNMASPEHKHSQEVLYDVPPLDFDIELDQGNKTSTGNFETSPKQPTYNVFQYEVNSTSPIHSPQRVKPHPPNRKRKVPPPTRKRPEKPSN